jgi:hypothetical protein
VYDSDTENILLDFVKCLFHAMFINDAAHAMRDPLAIYASLFVIHFDDANLSSVPK